MPRVSDESLAALHAGHRSVKVVGQGPWDGLDMANVVDDLIDARAELSRLQAQCAAYRESLRLICASPREEPHGEFSREGRCVCNWHLAKRALSSDAGAAIQRIVEAATKVSKEVQPDHEIWGKAWPDYGKLIELKYAVDALEGREKCSCADDALAPDDGCPIHGGG